MQSALQQWVWAKVPNKDAAQKPQEASRKKEEPAALPLIDWEESLVRCSNSRDLLESLLPKLPANLQETKATLAKAYAEKDIKALREELHRILGVVVFFSLPRIEMTIRAFQTAVKTKPQNQKQMETTYHELQQAFDAFCGAYEKGELTSKE